MMMLTKNVYSTMIGKQFSQPSFKLLCALIDQRIEYGLPSFMLRKRLLEEIEDFNKKATAVLEEQHKVEDKVRRDMLAFPFHTELTYKLSLVLNCGTVCKLDLKYNNISFTDPEGNSGLTPIVYVSQWQKNKYIRMIKPREVIEGIEHLYTVHSTHIPVITKENVSQCDNKAVLELLLTLTETEKSLLQEKKCPKLRS
ncbi:MULTISPECIES: hypothetical protein [Paenibacillus]|nr:hypothetical protein [Paenibacillus odorifer]